SSGRCPTSTRPWCGCSAPPTPSVRPARPTPAAGPAAWTARRSSPASTPPSPNGARPSGPPWRTGQAARPKPSRSSAAPGSTRPPAVNGSQWRISWRSWQPGKSGRRRGSPRVRAQARQDPPRARAPPPEPPAPGPAPAAQGPPGAHPRQDPPRARAHRRQDPPRVTERTGGAMVDSEIREDAAEPVHVRAPGKINLVLRVGATGPGGYHRLATVVQAVSLTEDVKIGSASCRERG